MTMLEMPTNGSAKAAARQHYDEMVAAGRKPNGAEIGRRIGHSGRTVSGWVREWSAEPAADRQISREDSATPALTTRQRPRKKTADRSAVDWAIIAVVAAVGAIWSYSHIVDLAIAAGHGWRSYLLPIAIDGLVIAAIRAAGADRRKLVAWVGITIGIAATVTFNVLAVRLELVDMDDVAAVLAAIPPIALAVTVHLVRR
jgi:hypothetical protein